MAFLFGNKCKKPWRLLQYVVYRMLTLIDYLLPSIDNYPKTKEYKYIASRDEVVEVPFLNAAIS